MNCDNYEESVKELIQIKLKEIEDKEQVKVLHAVESGSRAWGFASPDSDYDVRFIYVRSEKFYLELQQKKDFIDWELNETLDINGWDLSKVLQHFHKSNATMFEWGNSPIVYATTPEWERIIKVADRYFSCKAALYHYYGTANKNYREYLMDDLVKYKKYFYVLRPILACKWIEKKQCPPPVLFRELVDEELESDLKPIVQELIQKKIQMSEAELGKRIDVLNDYIVNQLSYYKQTIGEMADDRSLGWEELNQLFYSMICFDAGKGK